jgi:hypothetical protein
MQKPTRKSGTDNFEFLVDKLPYQVQVVTETFNDETRYRVRINGDDGHLFAWDAETVSLRALDDDSSTLPDGLEKAISDRLIKTTLMQ